MEQTNEIGYFRVYCNKVLPAVYDDNLTFYEQLCAVKNKLNEVITEMNKFGDEATGLVAIYKELDKRVTELENEVEAVKNGEYVHLYLDSIIAWIDANLQCVVSRVVKFVCFGLGDDGYFKAYIPTTWQFLQFDTGINPDDSSTYGHLIIKW